MNLLKRFTERATGAPLQADSQGSPVLEMLQPRAGSTPAPRGTTGMLQSYSTSPWVRAATSKIADAVGGTRWYLFAWQQTSTGKYVQHHYLRDRPDGSRKGMAKALSENVVDMQGDMREIVDHPFLRLMNGSNPVYPGHIGRGLTATSVDLTGEAYWMLDPVDNPVGVPENYWVIPPHWVTGLPSSDKPVWEVQGPSFKLDVPVGGMLRFCQPDPLNPYLRGTGHVRAMGDEIDVYEFASKHIRAWFKNRAIPDILVYGSNMDQSDTEVLEQHWTSKLRGFTRAHMPLFLRAKDIQIKELSQKFSDMQLSTLKKDDRDTIIHGLGFPPEIFGILESSNRSTIDAADYLFSKYVVVPRLELMRAFLQTFLVPRYDERLILAYESPMADDNEFQLQVMEKQPGAFKVNDWRKLAGVELADENEDVYMVPYNVQLRESLEPDPPPEQLLPVGDAPLALPAGEVDGEEADPKNAPVTHAGTKSTPACTCGCQGQAHGDVVDTGAMLRELFRSVGGEQAQGLALKLTKDMQSAVLDAWVQLRNHVDLRQLEAALENGTYEALLADLAAQGKVYEDAVGVLHQAVAIVGEAAAGELGDFINASLSFELTNPQAVAELERMGAELVTNVSDETIAALREALTDAYRTGKTGGQVAKEIREMIGLTRRDVGALGKLQTKLAEQVAAGEITQTQMDKFLDKWTKQKIRFRAQTIADHELNRAGNSGQQLLWEQAQAEGFMPSTARRQWVVAQPCEICAPMAGKTTRLNEPWYPPNGKTVMIPTDTHVRCKCTFVLVFVKP